MFADHKLGKEASRLGVANHRIVMRTVDLPPLESAKEITSAVNFQAQEHIPMPLDQAVLEHHSLGIVETSEGPRTRVIVVAARREMIQQAARGHPQGGPPSAGDRPFGVRDDPRAAPPR